MALSIKEKEKKRLHLRGLTYESSATLERRSLSLSERKVATGERGRGGEVLAPFWGAAARFCPKKGRRTGGRVVRVEAAAKGRTGSAEEGDDLASCMVKSSVF